jgi:hypothetical protein
MGYGRTRIEKAEHLKEVIQEIDDEINMLINRRREDETMIKMLKLKKLRYLKI